MKFVEHKVTLGQDRFSFSACQFRSTVAPTHFRRITTLRKTSDRSRELQTKQQRFLRYRGSWMSEHFNAVLSLQRVSKWRKQTLKTYKSFEVVSV